LQAEKFPELYWHRFQSKNAMTDFNRLFQDFKNIKVAVVGDVMLDTYWWGKVERISPEAPVPIVSLSSKDYRLGGAANVALNLKALEVEVAMFSVIGNDDDGRLLQHRFHEEGISSSYLLKSDKRITTNKSRIISRNQQMLRLDAEMTADLEEEDENNLIQEVTSYIQKQEPSVLIFEDYNKGVLTNRLIKELTELCRKHNIITSVDPKRKNFFSYKGVNIFKPNLKEVKEALNLLVDDVSVHSLENIHGLLAKQLNHDISFITLSEKGVFFKNDSLARIVPSHVRNISDVSGAGDTVIAVASVVFAATKNVELMAEIANIAGGLVCEEVGTAAINKQKLKEECELLLIR
jgi:rfaE bifunctional protein kinase chain/domain